MPAVVLGEDTNTGHGVTLDDQAREAGLYIIGATRTGKTTLLERLALHDMQAGHGLFFVDAHGDASKHLLEGIPSHRAQDVIWLDVSDTEYPFGLNLFECPNLSNYSLVDRTASQTVQVFKKTWGPETEYGSWGPRLEDLLYNIAYTLIENPGYTMVEIPELLTNGRFRKQLLQNVTNPVVQDFWQDDYDQMSDRDQREYRSSTINKVRVFLRNRSLRNIVGQPESTIRFRSAMDTRKIVLARLPLGVGEDIVSLLGSTMLSQTITAALTRSDTPEDQRLPFYVYADEYQRFSTPALATLFTETGKYRIRPTIAHEVRGRLDEASRETSLQTGSQIVFRIGSKDADELAGLFDTTPPPAEVVSSRHLQVPTLHPVTKLVHSPPTDEHAYELVRYHLKPLVDNANAPAETTWYTQAPRHPEAFKDHGIYLVGRSCFISAIPIIDEYLSKVMARKIIAGSEQEVRLLGQVTLTLRAWLHLEKQYQFERISMMKEEVVELSGPSSVLISALASDLTHLQAQPIEQLPLNNLRSMLFSRARTQLNEQVFASKTKSLPPPRPDIKEPREPSYRHFEIREKDIQQQIDNLYLRYLDGPYKEQMKQWQRSRPDEWLRWLVGDPPEPTKRSRESFQQEAVEKVEHHINEMNEHEELYLEHYSRKRAEWREAETAWRNALQEYENAAQQHLIENAAPALQTRVESELQALLYHLQGWIALSRYLQNEPVLVDSYRQISIAGSPRPHSDVRNEIANSLSHLDAYMARCRLSQNGKITEYTIHTLPLPKITDIGAATRQAQEIKKRSYADHAKPRDWVEDQIKERSHRSEKEEPPRTSRGVQR